MADDGAAEESGQPERGATPHLTDEQRERLASLAWPAIVIGAFVLLVMGLVSYIDLVGDANPGFRYHVVWWASWVVSLAFVTTGAISQGRLLERAAYVFFGLLLHGNGTASALMSAIPRMMNPFG